MKISSKGRYALRLMIDIAQHGNGEWISIKDVSARQGISIKYLEQIVTGLVKSGMLQSSRGPQGGYRLAQSTEKYTAGQILRVIEGPLAPVACMENESNRCDRYSICPTIGFWEGMGRVINEYADSVTLDDLAKSERPEDCFDFTI